MQIIYEYCLLTQYSICCILNLTPAFVLNIVRTIPRLGPDPHVEIVLRRQRFCLISNIFSGQVRIVCLLRSFSFSMWSLTTEAVQTSSNTAILKKTFQSRTVLPESTGSSFPDCLAVLNGTPTSSVKLFPTL